jgi:hypothetical protein
MGRDTFIHPVVWSRGYGDILPLMLYMAAARAKDAGYLPVLGPLYVLASVATGILLFYCRTGDTLLSFLVALGLQFPLFLFPTDGVKALQSS